MIRGIDGLEQKPLRAYKSTKPEVVDSEQSLGENQETIQKVSPDLLKTYYVSFNGIGKSKEDQIFEELQEGFTPNANKLWEHTEEVAGRYNHRQITHLHLYLAALEELDKYIEDLESGEKKYDPNSGYLLPTPLEGQVNNNLFKDEKNLEKISPVIKQEIEDIGSALSTADIPRGGFRGPKPTKELVDDINYVFGLINSMAETDSVSENILLASITASQQDDVHKMGYKLVTKLEEAVMVDQAPENEKVRLSYYDDKADRLWKNIDLGNNMFVAYDKDNENAPQYLLNSFLSIINEPQRNYKNLNKDNTEVILFNKNITTFYLTKVVDNARKNPDKTTVLIADFMSLIKNSSALKGFENPTLDEDDLALLRNIPPRNKPDNVKIILVANEDTYYANMGVPLIKRAVGGYGLYTLPVLNADETKKLLMESPDLIEKETKKMFRPNAIKRCIELSNLQEGNFPEKTLKLMKNIAVYFVDKDEITLADVNDYMRETKDILRTSTSSDSFKVVFDTGKKLKDIVGNDMTKRQAASIVRQIKDRSVGTKGFIIYSSNGASGGGRRHTAEAIAGEAKIPFVSINARDFALKDIDALSQNASLSELKITKLVNLAKTQAEANPHKSAMIFIENFDNFGSNPLSGISSIYEQKAFSQLLSEMDNIRRNEHINLVIVGSANYPNYIDESILKPNKFLDQIVVYSPQDTKDRVAILNYYIKKNHIKIAGETQEDRDKIIKNIAETTSYFSVVGLMDLLDKAQNVSKERGHKAVDGSDFTEAFLQAVSGRPSTAQDSPHRKAIVASHECGHAINLQIMYDIAESQHIPWHLPRKVDFITLDPRGNFGGAMFSKESENDEFNFEQVFADIVCDYGGHSAEKQFYHIDGSWGITSDMQMANDGATLAVTRMGLGPKTGKRSIPEADDGSFNVSPRVRSNIDKDIETFLKNANLVSDKIVAAYSAFIEEFTEKYKPIVGTGDCIIPGDAFRADLAEWKARQGETKIHELADLEKEILDIMEKTKKGEIVTA